MKKRFLTFCVFAFFAVLLGAETNKQSYIIKDGASLWSLKGKNMTWEASLPLGQPLLSVSKGITQGVYKDVDYELVKVKTDNNEEGYIIESLVARDAKGLAVVTNTLATLYSQARDTAVLSTIVPRMNIIAVWDVPGKADYIKVAGYAIDTGNSISEKFLLTSDISLNEKDINTALLLQAIKSQKKKEQKQKTAQIINQKYPGSVFSSTVSELKAALDTETLSTEDYSAILNATDTVNIRDIPSIYGSVIVAIKKGEKVTGVKRSTTEVFINELKGRWVNVSTPKEGWVFDAWFTAE